MAGGAAQNSAVRLAGQTLLWALPRAAWITAVVLVDQWVRKTQGGYSTSKTSESVFGWHALLMTLAFGVFTSEALLTYTAPLAAWPFGSSRPPLSKALHSFFHVLALVSWVLGLIAITDYKQYSDKPTVFPFFTMYSPHSWLGAFALGMWSVQLLGAPLKFFALRSDSTIKPLLVRFHRFLGKSTYVVGLAACALGLQGMQSSDLAGSSMDMASDSADSPLAPPPMAPMDMAPGDTMDGADAGGDDDDGYSQYSLKARLACATALMIAIIGIATFFTLEFGRRLEAPSQLASDADSDNDQVLQPRSVGKQVQEVEMAEA